MSCHIQNHLMTRQTDEDDIEDALGRFKENRRKNATEEDEVVKIALEEAKALRYFFNFFHGQAKSCWTNC